MAPTPAWDSPNESLMSGALAEKPTDAKLAAVSAASDSATPNEIALQRPGPTSGPASVPLDGVTGGRPSPCPHAIRSGLGDVAAGGRARDDPTAVEDELPPHPDPLGPSREHLTLVERVTGGAVEAAGVGARRQRPLLRVEVEPAGGVLAEHPHEVLDGAAPAEHAGGVRGGKQRPHARPEAHAGVPEVAGARLAGVHLAVRADAGDGAVRDAPPERVAVPASADRRLDLGDRPLVLGVGLGGGPVQERGDRLAVDLPALVLQVADEVHALPCAGVDDVDGHADLVGDERRRVDLHRLEDVGTGFEPRLQQPVAAAAAQPVGQHVPDVGVLRVDRGEGASASRAERLARLVEEIPRDAAGVHPEALGLLALVAEEELERPD